jgi:3-hydroxyisobutyrate dehydrogenase-like beta-hydroxyacid dehydrogenase
VRPVGVIGLGLLGGALAGRFLGHGLRVFGHDVREECRQRLAEAGGVPLPSAEAVARAADVIVLSLPDSDVVAAVLGGLAGVLPGKTVIDTTTGDPERTADVGRSLAAGGTRYLDATVAGSSALARAGEVVVMAGGEADVFREAGPLLALFARRCYHVGPWGSGARMKLVVNLVLGLNRAVLAEGLAFARRCGLDPGAALDVLADGPAYARVMDAKGRKMIDEEFTPEARLSQHLKDVRLILAAGERAGAELPFSRLHETLLAQLEGLGLGGCDNSAVIRAFEPPNSERG